MPNTLRCLLACVAMVWTGCIHDAAVGHGTWIGAAAGAVLGVGTGVLISDEHLLGSTKESQMQLKSGEAIASGALIGAVFGAVIGSMAGHQKDEKYGGRSALDQAQLTSPTPVPVPVLARNSRASSSSF